MSGLPKTDPRYNLLCWVVRSPCGCVCAICSDDREDTESTAEFVAGAIRERRNVEHVLFRDVYAEPTFFKCPHRTEGKQMEIGP